MAQYTVTQPNGGPAGKLRVLVAEDDWACREMLVAVLKADGHEVVAVANGLDLLDTLVVSSSPGMGSQEFDLVVSDVRMPGTTGIDVIARMVGRPGIPPVIFITAFGSQDMHAVAEEIGALAVFDKPFDFDELRTFVNGLGPVQN